MNTRIKLLLPIIAAVILTIAGSSIRNGGCSCEVPLTLFGSIMGCSGPSSDSAHGPDNDAVVPATAGEGLQARPAELYTGPVKVTFVEIGSVNCIPCKMMQPVMEKVEQSFAGQVKIVFHDVWTPEGRPYGMKYGIRAIPTQVFLDKNGKEYFRHEGFFPFEEVAKVLKRQGIE